MKKRGSIRLLAFLSAAVLGVSALGGCGKAVASEKEKVTLITTATLKPFTYYDEDNNLQGYEVELIKKVFEALPEYDVQIEVADFPALFGGLDSDYYQIGFNNFSYNEKRAEKYIYTNGIFDNHYVIVVPEGNDSIHQLSDLAGLSTRVTPGTSYATSLELYNEEHPDAQINLEYQEGGGTIEKTLLDVESGALDFNLLDEPMYNVYQKEFNLKIKAVRLNDEESETVGSRYGYYLVSKGHEDLAAKIDEQLAKLVADGTVKALGEKYFYGDYTPYDLYK